VDGLALLAEAHAVGLTVTTEGDRLVIRGPRAASAIADRLVAAKPAVLAALTDRQEGLQERQNGVWWDDRLPAESAAILHLPPRSCIAPRACSRLGVCPRRVVGQPCQITKGATP